MANLIGYAKLHKHFLFSLTLIVAAVLVNSVPAHACSCGSKATVLDSYNGAPLVVITRAVAVEKSQTGYLGIGSTRMVVETVFKGSLRPGDEMTFAQGGGADCVWAFSEDSISKRFLFYLGGRQPEMASVCGRSTRIENAGDDLLYLMNREKVQGRTRISGTLRFRDGSNVSLEGRKVRIDGPKSYVVETDKNGAYELYDALPGRYLISPVPVPGWKIDSFYHSTSPSFAGDRRTEYKDLVPITVEVGKHAALDLVFEVENAIAGHILDPDGNPMYGVCLHLLQPDSVKAESSFLEFDCSDKDGAFSIDSVAPGTYVLAVNKDGMITSLEPFRTFYYPAATQRTAASPIAIGIGEHVYLRIRVPEVAETVTIRGRLLYSDQKPVANEFVGFKADRSEATIDRDAHTSTDADGRFAIRILKGSRGSLYGFMYSYVGEFRDCPQLDAAIKKNGTMVPDLKTPAANVQAEKDVNDIEFRFPFPGCAKARIEER